MRIDPSVTVHPLADNNELTRRTLGGGEADAAFLRRPAPRSPKTSPRSRGVDRKGSGYAQAPGGPKQAAVARAEHAFKQQIGDRARDQQGFHRLMQQIYGARYDEHKVEQLRQRALKGDFSFLPRTRFVDSATLQGNHAAYDAASGTILLNERLLSEPDKLAAYYAEEAGHHIDTLFGAGDAVGDEGELLRHALAGQSLSAAELAAIRSEDDRGTITVDGRSVEVEFGFFKKIKKAAKKVGKGIKKAAKGVWDGVKSAAGEVWDGIKSAGRWVMTSKWGGIVMSAALAAFSVVTAGAGTAAMVAWEAAKQAALAVGRSVLVQKGAELVGKVTGSETLGRIAGVVGGAVAGGKVDFSSTQSFTRTAGAVARDIAANEAKRVARDEIVSRIDSPFLQTVAGYAIDRGIDAGANYAYQKSVDALTPTQQEKTVDQAQDNSASVRRHVDQALATAAQVKVTDVVQHVAPKELSRVLDVVLPKDAEDFTLGDLASAVRSGLNDFQNMSATDVARAIQDYTETLVGRLDDIDGADIRGVAREALRQAGELRAYDLIVVAGYDRGIAHDVLDSVAGWAGRPPEKLTLEDLFRLATGATEQAALEVAATA